jgi:phosphopantothenoylcysteine synthetase/decarboxylase
MSEDERRLCLIICAAGPAADATTLIDLAHAAGWTVDVVATPAAVAFLDAQAIRDRTGVAPRSDYAPPGEARSRASSADALIIAPATYNTANKLAAGINDTYALNVAAEAIGRRTPVAILPFVNQALADRRPFQQALRSLREEGVSVIYGPEQWLPHPPGTGTRHLSTFPWDKALAAVTARV